MATTPWTELEPNTLSVEQYLHTAYSPDCDYVDGIIEERNVGEFDHSRLQIKLGALFMNHEREWKIITVPECRLQVAERRFRVPHVMVLHESHKVTRIVREAPLLCIEILSPEDTWARMRARLNDYLAMGVEHVWCFDPDAREALRYTTSGYAVVTESELSIPGTSILVNLAELFSILD